MEINGNNTRGVFLGLVFCCVMSSHVTYPASEHIKQLYNSHYDQFKVFVFDLKKQVNSHSHTTIEYGARWWKWYSEFTIACIPISYPFFKQDIFYIESILKLVDERYLDHVEQSLARCKQKPAHYKLLDWIAQVSHEEHVNNIKLPEGIEKDILLKHPKEYQKIIDKVSPQERDALIVVGLFSRFLAEKNLL